MILFPIENMIRFLGKFPFNVLCLICLRFALTSDRLQYLRDAIQENNITSKNVMDTNFSAVTINKREYRVYVFDKNNSYTLNNVVTCINCEFGTWTVHKLFEFLEPFPSKNHASFMEIENDVFGKDYVESVKILDDTAAHTERFINILLNFVNMTASDSFFDAELLKSLLSLNLKIDYIKTLGNGDKIIQIVGEKTEDEDEMCYQTLYGSKNREKAAVGADETDEEDVHDGDDGDATEGHDDVIVRLIFESVNSIRGYMALNCEFPLPFYGSHQLNNYPMDETSAEKYEIDKFLNDIKVLNLEPPKYCSVKGMLLLETGKWVWSGIKWKTNDKTVLAEDIVKHVEACYDLDVILWYQELVFKTIMKIILVKVRTSDVAFPENVVDRFREFYRELVLNYNNLPVDIIEIFFTFFTYDSTNHNDLVTKIKKYVDSASEINLETRVPNPLFAMSLKEVLDLVLNDVDGVRCFVRLFEFLRRESRVSRLPYANDPEKIDFFVTNATKTQTVDYFQQAIGQDDRFSTKHRVYTKNQFLNTTACKYIRGLYHYCFGCINDLNAAFTQHSNSNHEYYNEAYGYIKTVHTYLTSLVSKYYWYRAHFKMAYYVVPMIEVHVMRNTESFNYHNLIRLVYTIVIEFNAYWLQYCPPPEFNFWFLQNINFGKMGLFQWVNNDILLAAEDLKNNGKQNAINSYHDLIDFSGFVSVFNSYKNYILFNWKFEKKSIGQIYENHKSVVLSVSQIYGFYNVYQRFFLAIVFYEVLFKHENSDQQTDEHAAGYTIGEDFIRVIDEMKEGKPFPEIYTDVMNKIHNLKKMVLEKTDTENRQVSKNDVDNEIQQIQEQFQLIGVFFETTDIKNFSRQKSFIDINSHITDMYNLVNQVQSANAIYYNEIRA